MERCGAEQGSERQAARLEEMLKEQAQPLNPQYYRTSPELVVQEYQGYRGREIGGRRQEKEYQGYMGHEAGARSKEQEYQEYQSYRSEVARSRSHEYGQEYRGHGEAQHLYEVPGLAWSQNGHNIQQNTSYSGRK